VLREAIEFNEELSMTLLAAHFLAGSLLSTILPIALLAAVLSYWWFVLRRGGA
jgi:hypothetical protein